MSAIVLPFRPDIDRDALIAQARANYESIFPTNDGGKARIQRRRKAIGLEHLFHGSTISDVHDLVMDHADNGMPSDSPYHAPDSDPA